MTAMSETWLARSMAHASAAPDNGLRVLFACAEGNHHVLGLRIVADAFELNGWTTDYMGADTSVESLVEQVRQGRPDLVGISATLPQHLRAVRKAILELRSVFGEKCPKIVVGGLVFNQFPGLAEWVGGELLGNDAVTAAEAAASQLRPGHRQYDQPR